MRETALLVAGVIFLLVSIMHLLRLVFKIEAKIGKFTIPLWFSIFGFIIPLLLSFWMFNAR